MRRATLIAMKDNIRILNVEKDGDDGLLVTYSDGTMAGYVVEELLMLRPRREHAEGPLEQSRHTTVVKVVKFSIGVPLKI